MAVYLVVCLWVTGILLGSSQAGGWTGMLLLGLAATGMLWLLNLYNFMDGIDGLAALQTIYACGVAALLAFFAHGAQLYSLYCLLLAAAHLGFLTCNWPPARLFMGDAGSVPTGFLMGALVIVGAVEGQVTVWSWLILLAPFITDASVTLIWRMVTGQPFLQAHRLHAYQRLSRYWGSHLRVDMLLVAIHSVWLLPLAFLAQWQAERGLFLVIMAYVPLLAGMAWARRLA